MSGTRVHQDHGRKCSIFLCEALLTPNQHGSTNSIRAKVRAVDVQPAKRKGLRHHALPYCYGHSAVAVNTQRMLNLSLAC